jgi:hypothetical protein
MNIEEPTATSSLQAWWAHEGGRQRGQERRVFYTLVCMITYVLWKNRNAWVEDTRRQHEPLGLVNLITQEYNLIMKASRREERVRDIDTARE